MLGVNEHMGLKPSSREIIFQEFQRIWTWYLIIMDRRTDRRTDDLASRGKNATNHPVDKNTTVVSIELEP